MISFEPSSRAITRAHRRARTPRDASISNPTSKKVASYHHDHVNDVAREVTTSPRRPRPARTVASKTHARVVSPFSTHSSGRLAETPRDDARLVVGRRFEARAIDRTIDRRRHARARETAADANAAADDARLARVRVRVRVRDADDDARERRRVDTAEAATARAFGQRPRRASSIPRRRRRAADDRSTTTETRARLRRQGLVDDDADDADDDDDDDDDDDGIASGERDGGGGDSTRDAFEDDSRTRDDDDDDDDDGDGDDDDGDGDDADAENATGGARDETTTRERGEERAARDASGGRAAARVRISVGEGISDARAREFVLL